MPQNLIIRADASPEIGVGHVMRCLAVAQAWQVAIGRVWFATRSIPDAVGERLRMEGFDLISLDDDHPRTLVDHAIRRQVNYIILDGQHFDGDYQLEIRRVGQRLLVIDDYGHANHYHSDCVVNSDLVAESIYVQREPGTRLLIGPQYALLRKEFTVHRKGKLVSKSVHVLITMGGSDPQNMTLIAMQAIASIRPQNVELRVIVGAANSRLDALRELARNLPLQIEVLSNVSDMPAHMQWADIGIVAAGVSLWELLHMGVAVIAWPRYPKDAPVLQELKTQGAVVPVALEADKGVIASAFNVLLGDLELRGNMQAAGCRIVDGLGAQRVVEVFSKLPAMHFEESKAN